MRRSSVHRYTHQRGLYIKPHTSYTLYPTTSIFYLLSLLLLLLLGLCSCSTVADAGRGGKYGSLLSICKHDVGLLQCGQYTNGTILDCLMHYHSNITRGGCRKWVMGSIICRDAVQQGGICDSNRTSLHTCIRSTSAIHFPAECVDSNYFKALKDFGRFRRPKAKGTIQLWRERVVRLLRLKC